MSQEQSTSPLDLSVNTVLDITPRKIGKLGWQFGKVIWDKVSNREVRQLRTELDALKTQHI